MPVEKNPEKEELGPSLVRASKVFLAALLAGIAVLLIRAALHRFSGSSPALYVGAALFAVFLLFVLTRTTSRFKVNLAVSLFLTIACVFFVELALVGIKIVTTAKTLKEVGSLSENIVAAKMEGAPYDPRTPLEALADRRKSDPMASVVFNYALDAVVPGNVKLEDRASVLPLAGPAKVFTVMCNESGVYANYQSDERGFNNPLGAHAGAGVDAVTIGDSNTQGECLNPGEEFVAHLRGRFARTVNLGWAGNGPLLALASLREYGARLKPKRVFWFWADNDISDLNFEMQVAVLKRYLEPAFTQGLYKRQNEVDKTYAAYVDAKLASAGQKSGKHYEEMARERSREALKAIPRLGELRARLGLRRAQATSEVPRDYALLKEVMRVLRTEAMGWGGKVYFVPVPSWERLVSRNASDVVNRYGIPNSDLKTVIELARAEGMTVIDLYEEFLSDQDPRAYFPHGIFNHLNVNGSKVFAERLLKRLD